MFDIQNHEGTTFTYNEETFRWQCQSQDALSDFLERTFLSELEACVPNEMLMHPKFTDVQKAEVAHWNKCRADMISRIENRKSAAARTTRVLRRVTA